jgi:hypothetical protein
MATPKLQHCLNNTKVQNKFCRSKVKVKVKGVNKGLTAKNSSVTCYRCVCVCTHTYMYPE